MRLVTECWTDHEFVTLSYTLLRSISGSPSEMLRLKADEVRAAVREVNRAKLVGCVISSGPLNYCGD
jgi:hypothetical protein